MKGFLFSGKKDTQKLIDVFLSNSGRLNLEQYQKICQVYLGQDKTTNPNELTNYFLTKARKLSSHLDSLKALLLLHKLTHTLKSNFTSNFGNQQLPNYNLQREEGVLAHLAFIEAYQGYLIKLIHNYEDFECVFLKSEEDHQIHLPPKNVSILHLLSKFQNILNHLLKFESLFGICLVQFPDEIPLKHAAYYILSDCHRFYSFVNKHVESMIDQVFTSPIDEAIFLYEVYSENLHMAKKVQKIMRFKQVLEDYEIFEPQYFSLGQEETKRMQTYIHSAKARIRIRMMKLDLNFNQAPVEEEFSPAKSPDVDNSQTRKNSMEEVLKGTNSMPEIKIFHMDHNVSSPTNVAGTATPSFTINGANGVGSFDSFYLSIKKKEIDYKDYPVEDKDDIIQEINLEENKFEEPKQSYTPSLNELHITDSTLDKIPSRDEICSHDAETIKAIPDSIKSIDDATKTNVQPIKAPNNDKKPLERAFTLGKRNFNQAPSYSSADKKISPYQSPNVSFVYSDREFISKP